MSIAGDVDQAQAPAPARARRVPSGAWIRVWIPVSVLLELEALARAGGCTPQDVTAYLLADGTCEPRRRAVRPADARAA